MGSAWGGGSSSGGSPSSSGGGSRSAWGGTSGGSAASSGSGGGKKKKGRGGLAGVFDDVKGAVGDVAGLGLKGLEKLTIPFSYTAAAINELNQLDLPGPRVGKDTRKSKFNDNPGFDWGDIHKNATRHIGFGDVVKTGNPAIDRGIGFALDVGLDPTTYLTLGASAVAKPVVKGAVKQAAKQTPLHLNKGQVGHLLEAAGLKEAAQTVAAKGVATAAKESPDALKAAGVQYGVRFAGIHIPGSEKLGATIGAKVFDPARTKVVDSALGRATRNALGGRMGPAITKLRAEEGGARLGAALKWADTQGRGKGKGVRQAADAELAELHKQFGDLDAATITKAIESGDRSNPAAAAIADLTERTLQRAEAIAGKRVPRIGNYIAHILTQDALDVDAVKKKFTGKKMSAEMKRDIEGTIEEINEAIAAKGGPKFFRDNPWEITTLYNKGLERWVARNYTVKAFADAAGARTLDEVSEVIVKPAKGAKKAGKKAAAKEAELTVLSQTMRQAGEEIEARSAWAADYKAQGEKLQGKGTKATSFGEGLERAAQRADADGTFSGMAAETLQNGGMTHNPITGRTMNIGDEGFGVSLAGTEERVALDAFDQQAMEAFADKHKDVLRDPDLFVGTWVDGGEVFMDISRVVADEEEALDLARSADQLAIFNFATGDTIRLDGGPRSLKDAEFAAIEEAAQALPPVADGKVRLYRGNASGHSADEHTGRWFSNDIAMAGEYARGDLSELTYVDVPVDVAKKNTFSGDQFYQVDDALGHRREVTVPVEYLGDAKPLSASTATGALEGLDPVERVAAMREAVERGGIEELHRVAGVEPTGNMVQGVPEVRLPSGETLPVTNVGARLFAQAELEQVNMRLAQVKAAGKPTTDELKRVQAIAGDVRKLMEQRTKLSAASTKAELRFAGIGEETIQQRIRDIDNELRPLMEEAETIRMRQKGQTPVDPEILQTAMHKAYAEVRRAAPDFDHVLHAAQADAEEALHLSELARRKADDLAARAAEKRTVAATSRNEAEAAYRKASELYARAAEHLDAGEIELGKVAHLEAQYEEGFERLRTGAEEYRVLKAMSEQTRTMRGAMEDGLRELADGRYAEPWVADALMQVDELYSPQGISEFGKVWDALTGRWRAWALVSFGYHGRNQLGIMFNNWLAGSGSLAVYQRYFSAHKKVYGWAGNGYKGGGLDALDGRRQKGMAMSEREAFEAMQRQGVGDPANVMDLGDLVTSAGRGDGILAVATGNRGKRNVNRWDPTSTDFGLLRANQRLASKVERGGRGPLFMDVMMRTGDEELALDKVMQFHFDYEDLSQIEKKYIKRLTGFYTWTRKNATLQLGQIAQKPGKYTAYVHAKRNLERDVPEDETVPSYYQELMAIRLPWESQGNRIYGTPDLPFVGLSKTLDPVGALSQMNPLIKTPLESMLGTSTFERRPFSETVKEAPETWGPLLHILKYADGRLGLPKIYTAADGTLLMNEREANKIESLIPVLSRARRLAPSEEKYQDRVFTSWLSFAFGIGTRTLDPASIQGEQLRLKKEASKQRSLDKALRGSR